LSGFINLAYPLRPSHIPLGIRVPQVENRWSRGKLFLQLLEEIGVVCDRYKSFNKTKKGLIDKTLEAMTNVKAAVCQIVSAAAGGTRLLATVSVAVALAYVANSIIALFQN
jgi:hypothetical protein